MSTKPLARRAVTAVTLIALAATTMAVSTFAGVAPAGADHDPAHDVTLESLPGVATGERPGPDVLYAPAPVVPQLTNTESFFRLPYVQISGSEIYQSREYIYTDHLYDDFGADTDSSGGSALTESAGDFTYPAPAERYRGNAADLVEFRIAGDGGEGFAFRFSVNTVIDPSVFLAVAAFDIDDDDSTGSATLPFDPGAPFPGTDRVLSIVGTNAFWSRWGGTDWITESVSTSIDVEANQFMVYLPSLGPDAPVFPGPTSVWQTTVATGILDESTGGWHRPGGDAYSGIYNLGFRFDEAYVSENTGPDTDQAAALAANDPTAFEHGIDFFAIRSGEGRNLLPQTGRIIRFYASRLDLPEGRGTSFPGRTGRLVPYSLYVPTTYDRSTPAPFTLNLHSLGQFHWQYNGSIGIQQLGEERGSIVATPDGRGDDGWYQDEAEVDAFEVWNDVARWYRLDPDRTALTGYSMGGYGTYRLATLYPDLFSRAMTIVGPPGDGIWLPPTPPTGGIETLSNAWLENARNVPFLNLVGVEDELVPFPGPSQQNIGPAEASSGLQSFDSLGYRYRYQVFPTAEHFTIALLSYDVPQAVPFFGDSVVDRDPFHVTFSYAPDADSAAYGDLGLVHDKAYWISDITLADPTVGAPTPKATVDAETLVLGIDDPVATRGTTVGSTPLPYSEANQTWGDPVPRPARNCVELRLTNVGSFTLDAPRAGLDDTVPMCLEATSTDDAIVDVALGDGSVVSVAVAAGTDTYTFSADEPPPPDVPEGRPVVLLLAALGALVVITVRRRTQRLS